MTFTSPAEPVSEQAAPGERRGTTDAESFVAAVYCKHEAALRQAEAALASREAPRSISDDPMAELRDIIAECLYEAANTDEQGPGGSVKHWAGWADEWLMGRVSEFVAGVVASREAEVRRKADERTDERIAEWMNRHDMGDR